MSDLIINAEVDQIKVEKIRCLLEAGIFAIEQEMLHDAIEEMIMKLN